MIIQQRGGDRVLTIPSDVLRVQSVSQTVEVAA